MSENLANAFDRDAFTCDELKSKYGMRQFWFVDPFVQ